MSPTEDPFLDLIEPMICEGRFADLAKTLEDHRASFEGSVGTQNLSLLGTAYKCLAAELRGGPDATELNRKSETAYRDALALDTTSIVARLRLSGSILDSGRLDDEVVELLTINHPPTPDMDKDLNCFFHYSQMLLATVFVLRGDVSLGLALYAETLDFAKDHAIHEPDFSSLQYFETFATTMPRSVGHVLLDKEKAFPARKYPLRRTLDALGWEE